ncbi:hypothetical protein TorRG33x02_125630 [Trema orientale]|uniref:Uncharacterized protein n=1 Tax=Trema orientale TaxID=63057 RepID=A0A2P5F1R9_TREOI|nr:hypothetical protein TorRG33x02_125630 [Trema orientale]
MMLLVKLVDLVNWVHSTPAGGETPEQILDVRFSTNLFGCRKKLFQQFRSVIGGSYYKIGGSYYKFDQDLMAFITKISQNFLSTLQLDHQDCCNSWKSL